MTSLAPPPPADLPGTLGALRDSGYEPRTVKEEILRCRLDRVRRLLADTDLPISEIVAASGFTSTDALTRAVRNAEGLTPLRLRRRLREERGGTAGG